MELLSIPLYIGWTVRFNGNGLELQYQHREQKAKRRYLDYDQTLRVEYEGEKFRLILTRFPKTGPVQIVEEQTGVSRDELPQALSWLQCLPRAPGDLVPLKIPAGWTALWNTFDNDYIAPEFLANVLAPAENFSSLHWERDIAMFVNRTRDPELYLDLEDWSDENMRTAAVRVHLYYWTDEGQVTVREQRTQNVQLAIKTLEEFFLWNRESGQFGL